MKLFHRLFLAKYFTFEKILNVVLAGASFHNASAASAECSSGSVIATLTCGSITCGNPVLDPEGNVPDAIVNGEDAEIESWPWQVSLRSVSRRIM